MDDADDEEHGQAEGGGVQSSDVFRQEDVGHQQQSSQTQLDDGLIVGGHGLDFLIEDDDAGVAAGGAQAEEDACHIGAAAFLADARYEDHAGQRRQDAEKFAGRQLFFQENRRDQDDDDRGHVIA